ncbi:hypothetical protein FNH09_10730 [Streptomyces adustus]|uniref:Uncharacterized protein n=1 Tax=Streptomyces adustus TaxID=1609272 RepID=A0A5N8V941_9ACTN|nr:hypothetical protein [Streptomyces adustus]
MMPSVTVLVSSDTDIYISPGLYGDCLPTVATGGAADSFRAGRVSFRFRWFLRPSDPSSCSHMTRGAENGPSGFMSHRHYGRRQSDVKQL